MVGAHRTHRAGQRAKGKTVKLVYLASPYSHRDAEVQQARFLHAAKASAWLIRNFPDENVFSPIVHSHILHKDAGLGGNWDFWKRIDTDFLERSDELMVLCIPGWDESVGIDAETEIAEGLDNIGLISYMIPLGEDNYRIQSERPEVERY